MTNERLVWGGRLTSPETSYPDVVAGLREVQPECGLAARGARTECAKEGAARGKLGGARVRLPAALGRSVGF